MLKRVLILALLCTTFVGRAQLVIDSTFNWQQLIPTILGGACVQISNVTYNSNQNASARFVCQNGFMGLSSGILISTGKASLAAGPNNSTSKGIDLQSAGDVTLNGLVNGTTYDAVVLEFDFTSAEDDSVFVKYVFASEEYTEFVGTEFNDVFGFFVSGPGIFGQQNIALIPGTSTPVAINNVNQNSFSNFFVDNTGGTECQYDGFTTPFTAFFFAQANQTYHLKIAISDVSDGIYDSGVFLQSYPGIYGSIPGSVSHLGQPATAGSVELIGFNINQTEANIVSTQPINTDGSYLFTGVAMGAYIIRSTLDTVLYPNTYPRYYNNALVWSDAEIVVSPCDTFSIDMQLMVSGTGNGEVSGTINEAYGQYKLISGASQPIPGVRVFLVNDVTGAVHGYAVTNEAGKYSFKNINEGDYSILVDILGIKQATTREVTVTKDNNTANNQNYYVADKIYAQDFAPEKVEVGMYPNPVNEQLNITLILPLSSKVTADMYDVTGRKVESLYNGTVNKGSSILQVPANNLSAGIYYIKVYIGDEKHTFKMIKASN